MIKLTEKIANRDATQANGAVDATLTLPLQSRIKSRLRVVLDNGESAGLFLARGTTLRDGDVLCARDGYRVQVRAANETLSIIHSDDAHLLARACYHLGNRHVSIQIEPDSVRYAHDHVLDDMLRGLGFTVDISEGPFEPEPGAYGGSAAQAAHNGHAHTHGHHHQH